MDSHAPAAASRRAEARPARLWILAATLVALIAGLVATDLGGASPAEGADTTTTVPAPVVALGSFPVQGKCSFSDTFGAARSGGRSHEGVDLIAKTGQFIYAAADGTLTKKYLDAAGSLSGNGWRLTITGGTYFFYAHMSGFAPGLEVGSKVVAGQIIGYVGATGNAGTPHLHFEIHPGGGAAINPYPSVKAIDGCATTAVPPVATNPGNPGQTDQQPTGPTLAKAVRIPATAATTVDPTAVTTPTTAAPTTTVPATTTTVASLPTNSASGTRWAVINPVVLLNLGTSSPLPAATARTVSVASVSGISASSTALVVRVSATSTAAGTVTLRPCASTGSTTTLVLEPNVMAVSSTVVGLTNRSFCVTSTVATTIKITATAQTASSGVGVRPVGTVRALDSRVSGRLVANQTVALAPPKLGVSSDTKAVAITVTVIDPDAEGSVVITACSGTELRMPFVVTPLAAFSVIVPSSTSGLCVASTTGVHLVVDVTGGWDTAATGVAPVTPVRVLGSGTGAVGVGSASTVVTVAGVGSVPANATVVLAHVTLTAGGAHASVFVWPCAAPRPAGAAGVAAAGRAASFVVPVALSAGQLCIATNAAATAVVDIVAAG